MKQNGKTVIITNERDLANSLSLSLGYYLCLFNWLVFVFYACEYFSVKFFFFFSIRNFWFFLFGWIDLLNVNQYYNRHTIPFGTEIFVFIPFLRLTCSHFLEEPQKLFVFFGWTSERSKNAAPTVSAMRIKRDHFHVRSEFRWKIRRRHYL